MASISLREVELCLFHSDRFLRSEKTSPEDSQGRGPAAALIRTAAVLPVPLLLAAVVCSNELAALDPHFLWCINGDADSAASHLTDPDSDVVADLDVLAFFSRENKHFRFLA